MLAQDIMTPCVAVCSQYTRLRKAVCLMREHHCNCLPVVLHQGATGPIIGVVSEYELIYRVLVDALDPVVATVWLVMTTPAIMINYDETLEVCLQRLRDQQADHLVVIDHNGAYCGIIAQAEFSQPNNTDSRENTSSYLLAASTHRTFYGLHHDQH